MGREHLLILRDCMIGVGGTLVLRHRVTEVKHVHRQRLESRQTQQKTCMGGSHTTTLRIGNVITLCMTH